MKVKEAIDPKGTTLSEEMHGKVYIMLVYIYMYFYCDTM